MYLAGEEERHIEGPDFEGILYTKRQYEIIGQLGGVRFDAELKTNYGKDHLRFLVSEQTGGMGQVYSEC